MKKNIIIIIVLVIATVGSFYGGIRYGSLQNSQPSNGQGGQFRNSGINVVRSGNFGANGGGAFSGQMLSKDDSGITIQLRDGSSKIILLSSSTTIIKSATGTLQDLAQGSDVTVVGKTNSDGSVTAESIQVRQSRPPLNQ